MWCFGLSSVPEDMDDDANDNRLHYIVMCDTPFYVNFVDWVGGIIAFHLPLPYWFFGYSRYKIGNYMMVWALKHENEMHRVEISEEDYNVISGEDDA